MNYSFQTHTGDGSTTTFTFPFGIIDASNIHVYLDGVETTGFTVVESPGSVTLSSAPASGVEIMIRREMDKTQPYSDFSRGSAFTKDNMNNSFLTLLYMLHEVLDGFSDASVYLKGDLDMGGYSIVNLKDAATDQGALTKIVYDLLEARVAALEGSAVISPSTGALWKQLYTVGAGGQSVFTHTAEAVPGASLLDVFVNGVYQQKDAYTETDSFTVTMSETIPEGATVEIRGMKAVEVNTTAASNVTLDSGKNVQDIESYTSTEGSDLVALAGGLGASITDHMNWETPEKYMTASKLAAWKLNPTTTDVTTEVQTAIDAAGAGSGLLYLAGQYYVTGLSLNSIGYTGNAGHIRISGGSSGARNSLVTNSALLHDGSSSALLEISGTFSPFNPGGGVVIENLRLKGGANTTYLIDADQLNDGPAFSLRNCYLDQSSNKDGHGIKAHSCYTWSMDNVRIYGGQEDGNGATGIGLHIHSVSASGGVASNMQVFNQVDIYKWGVCLQIGDVNKVQQNTVGPIVFNAGQFSHSEKDLVIVGRGARAISFNGCHFEHWGGNGGNGLVIGNGATNVKADNCTWNGVDSLATEYAVTIGKSSTGNSDYLWARNVSISGEFFQCRRAIYVETNATSGADVTGITLDNLHFHPLGGEITDITFVSGTTYLATFSSDHNAAVGLNAVISNSTNFNGSKAITSVPSSTTFEFTHSNGTDADETGISAKARLGYGIFVNASSATDTRIQIGPNIEWKGYGGAVGFFTNIYDTHNNSYQPIVNKFLEQRGLSNGASGFTVTLPVAMPDSTYRVLVTPVSGAINFGIGSKTATGFNINHSGGGSVYFAWHVWHPDVGVSEHS